MDTSNRNVSASTKWIDNPMIEMALKKHRSCEAVTVQHFSIEPACKTGAAYASQIFRLKVTFRVGEDGDLEEQSLIVKTDHDRDAIKELAEEVDAFDTESLILGEVMGRAHEALRQVEGSSFRPLTAPCLLHGTTPRAFIVLDDLVAAGYRLPDADRPLDYQHCEVVMRAYARLHAATAHVLSERPDYGARLNTDKFTDDSCEALFAQMVQCFCSAVADFLKKLPGWEHYAPKYTELINTLVPRVKQSLILKRRDTKLKVLVHGDCWKNNMMFKYSEGKAVDLRLVDFQMTHASSPARDLVYFLFANAVMDAHERLPSLLETYHSQLQASLRSLGMTAAADAYPLSELLKDIEDLQPFALYTSTLSGFVHSWERIGDKFSTALQNLSLSPDLLNGAYDNEFLQPYIKYVTRLFESKGLL